ncbi:hypothetical protein KAR52_00965 [Candidatus Pacearchaeota archaeon]|nr:hypothetical protein [Candidatus Pacearchaeota archaeon]
MNIIRKLIERKHMKDLAKVLGTSEMTRFLEEKRKETEKKIPKEIREKKKKDFLLSLSQLDYKKFGSLKEIFKKDSRDFNLR